MPFHAYVDESIEDTYECLEAEALELLGVALPVLGNLHAYV